LTVDTPTRPRAPDPPSRRTRSAIALGTAIAELGRFNRRYGGGDPTRET